MNKKFSLLFLVTAISMTGCTTTNSAEPVQASPQPPKADYRKKLEILDRLENHDTTLSRMTEILAIEWQRLFTQENEEKLWDTYFSLTWNVRPDEKEKVKKELSAIHPEFASYLALQKQGILPAKSVTIKNLMADRNKENTGYLVKATYLLTLNNEATKEIQVELNADDNMETFNPRFHTVATGENLPEPQNEQERLRQEFILRALDYNVIKKMTYEEVLEMMK
ncbi:hypothetical protein [Brevibacillus agri]|uniref:hypothetical protein n=1 Tax=Brevibacillus agri TaxID=51101 RepID=UPI0028708B08|nr:hypothetical protein [Brevibacillus agri]MDR9505880.1 hypothetical protein [Brevibacillus agri]MDT7985759.1 hypothetical protein [Clostridium perfringens]